MGFTLKQLRYFLSVAEHGNVTTASEHLFISQPAISNAINKLETHFGLQLLVRHHAKGVSLTPAGRDILAHIKGLLKHVEEVNNLAKEHSTSLSGVVHLGCFITIAPLFIPKLIKSFNEIYPNVDFIIHEGNIDELNQLLLRGEIELALTYDIGITDRLKATNLTQLPPKVIVSSNHSFAKEKTEKIGLDSLEHEELILLDLPYSRDYFLSLFIGHKFKPRIKHRTPSFEMLRSLVANGVGYSIINVVPEPLSCYDGSELVTLSLDGDINPLPIVMTKVDDVRLPLRAQRFLEHCTHFFTKKA